MKIKKAYIDIEAIYNGNIDPRKNWIDKEKFFKDYENWKFYFEKTNAEYCGIIGILLVDLDVEGEINKVVNTKFTQMIGKEITKERLMKELELDRVNEIISYHGRSKPNRRGYTGYDFGVIGAQLGVVLDEFPGVKSIDLELCCHSVGLYGGLKNVEMDIPEMPPRKSGIVNGFEEEKLLRKIAIEEDENKKNLLWKKAKLYNREDVVRLVKIEWFLRKIRYAKENN